MFFRKAISLKFFLDKPCLGLGGSKASWTPLAFPRGRVCLVVSCFGIGCGVVFSVLTSEADGSLVPISKLKLQKLSSFLTPVYAASIVEEVADEDINKSDRKSKALEIKSLDMRKTENFIADVVEHTAPAVVQIVIKQDSAGKSSKLFSASGFIVKEDGLILTSAHVFIKDSVVSVKLHDGRVIKGYVEHLGEEYCLATVRIPCTNLPVIRLGSSAHVRLGEFVVAMGSPRSLSNTVTAGVVSSNSRRIRNGRSEINYIQTDAMIMIGNIGGPLVNLDGEAIGINVNKIEKGLSFATHIDYGKDFLKKADASPVTEGKTTIIGKEKAKPFMGVTMLTLTTAVIEEFQPRVAGLSQRSLPGVLVETVHGDSPSFKSGLRAGDIITEVNGHLVITVKDVYTALETSEKLQLEIQRKKKKLRLTILPEMSHFSLGFD